MGTSNDNVAVNLDYPVAFLEAFERLLVKSPERPPFRYVLLGGMFVTQDQDASLWFLEKTRKQKVSYAGLISAPSLLTPRSGAARKQSVVSRGGPALAVASVHCEARRCLD